MGVVMRSSWSYFSIGYVTEMISYMTGALCHEGRFGTGRFGTGRFGTSSPCHFEGRFGTGRFGTVMGRHGGSSWGSSWGRHGDISA